MPGTPQRRTHDYRRHGTTNLFAALDAATGNVITSMTPRHRSEEFRKFLNLIDKEDPQHLDVHIVSDNVSTHKTPAIGRWLVRHPRFSFHFTPTYSSWMNLVERWFSELTTKWIRRGAHTSVTDLKDSANSTGGCDRSAMMAGCTGQHPTGGGTPVWHNVSASMSAPASRPCQLQA